MTAGRSLDKAWFAQIRWEMQDLLRDVDDAPVDKEDLRKRIDRLEAGGRIPETTARLMHLILTARNKAEYNQRVYSGADASQLIAAWQAVQSWRRPESPRAKPASAVPPGASAAPPASRNGLFACPIPGCRKVFRSTRGGWDAHVASYSMHPCWYPDVIDGEERKRHFRQDFASWFS